MCNLQGFYKYFNDHYRAQHETFHTDTIHDTNNTNRQHDTMMHDIYKHIGNDVTHKYT